MKISRDEYNIEQSFRKYDKRRTKALTSKRGIRDKYNPEFITCGFCGCYTNANLRRCCDEGYEQDKGD